MSFEAQIPDHIMALKQQRASLEAVLREMRRDALESEENHEMCCDECPRKADWERSFDDAEQALEESDDWREKQAERASITAEIERLIKYRDRVMA